MKRLMCMFLFFSMLVSLFGCTGKNIEEPLSFYYLRQSYAFGGVDSIIASEIVDGSQYNNNISLMLGAYLRGPSEPTLESPFPAGTYLLNTEMYDDRLIITLSNNFASLSGVKLSLACCALAKTILEFASIETVEIRSATVLLDGEESIAVRASDIALYDDYDIAATGSTE